MKTLEELYGEILKNGELSKAFGEALRDNKAGDFLKANGCGAGTEELAAFLAERRRLAGAVELSDEALDDVAGGGVDLNQFGTMVCPQCHSWFITVTIVSDYKKNGHCSNCGHDWVFHDWLYTML